MEMLPFKLFSKILFIEGTLGLYLNRPLARKKLSILRCTIGSDGRPCSKIGALPAAALEAIGPHKPEHSEDSSPVIASKLKNISL